MLRTWWRSCVTEHDLEVKRGLPPGDRADNIAKMAEGCCRIIEQWSEERG
jgi:hypothetical protein